MQLAEVGIRQQGAMQQPAAGGARERNLEAPKGLHSPMQVGGGTIELDLNPRLSRISVGIVGLPAVLWPNEWLRPIQPHSGSGTQALLHPTT